MTDERRQATGSSIVLAPDFSELTRARRFLAELATEVGFSDERVFDITVACSEATANAIEHASVKGQVQISTSVYPDRLEVEIEGPGEFQTPDSQRERSNRGLGLPLMVKLADHLALYSGARGGTLVNLTFYRPGARPGKDGALPPTIRELIEENELISAITENAPVGIYVLGPDLRYRWANPAYQAYLDEPYRSQDITGLFIGDVVPGAAEAGLIDELKEVSQTGEPISREDQALPGFARGPTWWRRRILPLLREDGQPPYELLVVAVDETAHVQAELALLESQRDLDRAQEVGQIGWWRLDTRENVLTWSDESYRIFGVPQGTPLTYETFLGMVHPADREYVDRQWHAGLRGAPYDIEHRIIADGQVKWVREKAYLELDSTGQLQGGFGIVQDITHRKQAEEALRASEERYRGLFENMLDGFAYCQMLYDNQGRPRDFVYLAVNEMFGELTGLRDVLGRKVTDVIPRIREETPELFEIYGRVARGGKSERFEIDFTPLSKWFEVALSSPARDHFVAVFEDITERKRAEEALQKSEEKYRALAAENERLYHQQLEIAERLQSTLLNIPSELGSVRIGHLYHSSTEAARVGGDFYDVFQVKDGKIVVLIGDVAGHGIEAARAASLTKDVIHAFTHQTLQPHRVLRLTNILLIEKALSGFVSAFLGILDPQTGRFDYASAGHPSTLLRRRSGEVQMLGEGSAPLGVYPDGRWKSGEVQLAPEDILLLYTDGVTEARRNRDFFGEERLKAFLKRRHVSAERLPALVLDQVLAFSGGSLHDDVAMLSISRTGEGLSPKRRKRVITKEKLLGS